MAKASTPPPLRAIGGWPDADWFCPSVLRDQDVIGFTFPKLQGRRKQNFRLVERSDSQTPAHASRRSQSGIGLILEASEAACAAAFRRATFLFESSPVLYFAEIPPAKLKIRAADQLRRNLIDADMRGCVLHLETRSVVAMFWPSAETDITQFVDAASPPYPMHLQFTEAEEARARLTEQRAVPAHRARSAASPDQATDAERQRGQRAQDQQRRRYEAERRALVDELNALRVRVVELQRSQSTLGALETLGLDDARLKSMLRLLHPDRHGNSEAANEAAKWVNNLRDILKSGKTA